MESSMDLCTCKKSLYIYDPSVFPCSQRKKSSLTSTREKPAFCAKYRNCRAKRTRTAFEGTERDTFHILLEQTSEQIDETTIICGISKFVDKMRQMSHEAFTLHAPGKVRVSR